MGVILEVPRDVGIRSTCSKWAWTRLNLLLLSRGMYICTTSSVESIDPGASFADAPFSMVTSFPNTDALEEDVFPELVDDHVALPLEPSAGGGLETIGPLFGSTLSVERRPDTPSGCRLWKRPMVPFSVGPCCAIESGTSTAEECVDASWYISISLNPIRLDLTIRLK